MREVLTLGDFSLARAAKLYPTLKEQLPEDNGPNEKQQNYLSSASSSNFSFLPLINYNRPVDGGFISRSTDLSSAFLM